LADETALVAGIGAIGGWLLARLTEGGAEVTGWARGATYERLAAGDDLVLESHERSWRGPVRVVDHPDGPHDFTFVCAKSQDTDIMSAALQPGGVVVSVQNGVENAEVLRRRHPDVVSTVVYSGCRRADPVTIEHASAGFLVTDDERVAGFLERYGVGCRTVDDLPAALWGKLMANVTVNSLCAILRSPIGAVFGQKEIGPVALDAMREVIAVAAAEGVVVDEALPDAVLAGLRALPVDHQPSTLQDVLAGRALEVDALTGVVVRKGDEAGVPVPTVRALDALLRAVDPARAT
jgi:2-dehydropantoate 2-reductase